jgi:hypothetical protein
MPEACLGDKHDQRECKTGNADQEVDASAGNTRLLPARQVFVVQVLVEADVGQGHWVGRCRWVGVHRLLCLQEATKRPDSHEARMSITGRCRPQGTTRPPLLERKLDANHVTICDCAGIIPGSDQLNDGWLSAPFQN